jgi:2-polyprenyl-3-methyl-5-hydroxy-6-metoxy-1,4-benzoquinol methylase
MVDRSCSDHACARPRSDDALFSRWNRIYKEEPDRIRWEPNEFLASVAAKLTPGDALDVAMGQGRNSLYLAREGWNVTGLDLSDVGGGHWRLRSRVGSCDTSS